MCEDPLEQDAHIPVSLRDPVLELSSALPYIGDLPTVFVGIVDEAYTEEMWKRHAERISSLFQITDPNMVCEIKIRSLGDNTIDGSQLGKDMTAAINALAKTPVEMVRIVGIASFSRGNNDPHFNGHGWVSRLHLLNVSDRVGGIRVRIMRNHV